MREQAELEFYKSRLAKAESSMWAWRLLFLLLVSMLLYAKFF